MARKFYKTVIVLEILSEREPVPDDAGLKEIAHNVLDGPWSYTTTSQTSEEITGEQMANLATEQGTDPGFFRLDEDGNNTDEDDEEDEED